jgi:hypothetical protein
MDFHMIFKLLLVFFTLVFSSLSFSGSVTHTKIVEIRQRPSGAIIRFDKKFDDACSDGGTWAIFRGDDSIKQKQTWSLLLSAAAAGKSVTIISSACQYHNNINDVYVYY